MAYPYAGGTKNFYGGESPGALPQLVEVINPLTLAAAPEDAKAVLDIPGRGIKLAGGNGPYVRFIFFIPEKIVI